MHAQEITNVSLAEFQERTSGKKIILLYPWTTYRLAFLSHWLASSDTGVLYFRIPDGQVTLIDWLAALADEFDAVLDGFAGQLHSAIQVGKPALMGEALAADLDTYGHKPLVLFIDEFDRVPFTHEVGEFIRALAAVLPEGVQLAFSSRLLTYQPWYDWVEKGEAAVLGTERRKDEGVFTLNITAKPQVEVYALGKGHVLVNGQAVSDWDGALPRNLFFYFMDNPLVTRDEIFAIFWPELPLKEATNVFHVTKRKISERISWKVGDNANYELTQYSGGFYMPSDKVVRHYDVADFQEALENSLIASTDEQEERLLMQAIAAYKYPFLPTVTMAWANAQRERLRELYAQALIRVGHIHKRRQQHLRALGFFVRALKETPLREDIHREIIALYLKLGMVADARWQYRRLETILHDTLGIPPSPETLALVTRIEGAE